MKQQRDFNDVRLRLPVRIVKHLQDEVNAAVDLLIPGSRFIGYVVRQRRGSAYILSGSFTIPLWAYQRSQEYFFYYVAHEVSHLLACEPGHGEMFYDEFKRLCPSEWQHYEIEYKPRLAKAAGISEKRVATITEATTSHSGSMDSMAKNEAK